MERLAKVAETDAARKAFSLVEEFKTFAFKGNVIDLAVGVIIGGAFGKIVDSLVKHIVMPVIGVLLPGKQGYLGWEIVIGESKIPYGLFIGEIVNFAIVAAAIFFLLVKFLGALMQTKKEEAAAPPPPTKEQELLAEIRDILQKQRE